MRNGEFSFQSFDFSGARDVYSPLWGFQMEEEVIKGKQNNFSGPPAHCGDYDSLGKQVLASSDLGSFSEFLAPNDMQCDVPATISSLQELMKFQTGLHYTQNTEISEKDHPISLTSLEILCSFQTGNKMPNGEKALELTEEAPCLDTGCRRSSTVEVMRMAGSRYIQLSEMDNDLFMLRYPFGSMHSGLLDKETKGVELAHLLLASAEKIHNQQYERASKLLSQCESLSSHDGDPLQRVVSYFAIALRERIEREVRGKSLKSRLAEEIQEESLYHSPTLIACHQQIPFSRVMQFTSIQAIIDNVVSAKRVHLIDLSITIGLQWSILMQALADRSLCRIELLKITAVGRSKERMEETGKMLASFAETLNLPFVFKSLQVSDMKDLKVDMFEVVYGEEAVAVYAPVVLWTMIIRPDCLENLMRVIRGLNPCVMAVVEIEANHNSTSFVNRFIEALFYFSAWFDCLEACMDRNDCTRMAVEGKFFSLGIRNIVAAEGSERITRHVNIGVWRAYFMRFRFVEVDLSDLSLYQANLLVKQFGCESCCTLGMNGKGLTVGWKGTPLHSVSAWKLK